MSEKRQAAVMSHALRIPGLNKLAGKRVVLASGSPRRKEILKTFGLAPEVIPSTFEEDLNAADFEDIHEYPVATATHKAVEVYERLVMQNPDDGPDLVIGADTVVLTHAQPVTSDVSYKELPLVRQDLLEKPDNKADNLRMLLDLNGSVCEVVTGVSVGELWLAHSTDLTLNNRTVFPILTSPGYAIRSIEERSLVYFSDNPTHLLEAYVDSGEGLDRAGGFAVQVSHLLYNCD
ncbi:Maf/Ham1 [Amylostereum chailletii]|nr:Maf/Ham1 [Amylostereum chailletii]